MVTGSCRVAGTLTGEFVIFLVEGAWEEFRVSRDVGERGGVGI